ncbi:NAD(P)/FAD-dependent oxidoreductase [Shimia abyssi]|uniref:Putative NAD/FAD-binding protein n=1 Tax=Shimia abyssi TaxID=1662395 RepID=A0A2P8FIU5_9RHOB|nr:FAD-dependent oxidoreductase [Shimia abyssi]PSL21631.1 putative NAD/FAD-binding protein [Shimia abyssi]
MSFDAYPTQPQRIAIVGGGISGLAAAYLLAPQHAVTLYEAAPRLGGHARTVNAGLNGDQPVDTGFIVFNYANYPHLTRMFTDLDVPVTKSDMTFGASADQGRVEYSVQSLGALVAQKRNLLRPGFLRMVRDILRFNARAEALAKDDLTPLGDLMDELGTGEWFGRYYLTPLCGAIWSTPTDRIRQFPAQALVRFFRNHSLLSGSQQHQWWTVKGGSIEYVSRLTNHLRSRGVALRSGTPVTSVKRTPVGVTIAAQDCEPEQFDQVIMACHSDQSLALLETPTEAETRALKPLTYQDNTIILHRDPRQMPRRRSCWSSWVYKADTTRPEPAIGVTYWMNRLQNIPETDPLFISLNPSDPIPDEMIYDHNTFRHPVFDTATTTSQNALRDLQGQNNTWFAGAYTRHGFHEDGFASAVRIARQLDATPHFEKVPA